LDVYQQKSQRVEDTVHQYILKTTTPAWNWRRRERRRPVSPAKAHTYMDLQKKEIWFIRKMKREQFGAAKTNTKHNQINPEIYVSE
jgi:hypothetical protein